MIYYVKKGAKSSDRPSSDSILCLPTPVKQFPSLPTYRPPTISPRTPTKIPSETFFSSSNNKQYKIQGHHLCSFKNIVKINMSATLAKPNTQAYQLKHLEN